MSRFILHHRHEARECPVVIASWKAFASPLRGRTALASCAWGGHEIWWSTEAASAQDALGHLPPYVAARTTATEVGEIELG